MGCQASKKGSAKDPLKGALGAKTKEEIATEKASVASAEKARRAKLDPKDFIISSRTKETIVKEAGSINGEQFNIENCKDCDIFLLDFMDSSFIDDCVNCRIFVGPTMSSVFLRNCQSCSMMIACRQFRSRDCADCKFGLFATTEPVIETSTNMQFACFEFFYFSIGEQMRKAQLKVWNNKWWQIHDFNKNVENPNWGVFPQAEVATLLRTTQCTSITAVELENDAVVPLTLGCRPRPVDEACFVIFMPRSTGLVMAFLARARLANWTICRTRSTVLADERLKQLFAWTKEKGLVDRCKGQELTGIEVCGHGIQLEVEFALSTTGLAAGTGKNIRIIPPSEGAILAKGFFETWKDEI